MNTKFRNGLLIGLGVLLLVVGVFVTIALVVNGGHRKEVLKKWSFTPSGPNYHLRYGKYPRKFYIDDTFSKVWKTSIIHALVKLDTDLSSKTGFSQWVEFGGYWVKGKEIPQGDNQFVIYSETFLRSDYAKKNFPQKHESLKEPCKPYLWKAPDDVQNSSVGYLHYYNNFKERPYIVMCDKKLDKIEKIKNDEGARKIRQLGKGLFVAHEVGHTIWGGNHVFGESGLMNESPSFSTPSDLEIEILKKYVVPLRKKNQTSK